MTKASKAALVRSIDEFIQVIKALNEKEDFPESMKLNVLFKASTLFAKAMRQYFISLEKVES